MGHWTQMEHSRFHQRIAPILDVYYNWADEIDMQTRRTTLLLILLVGITPAQRGGIRPASQATSPSDHEKCVIQGTVTKLPTGEPLKGAEVFLAPEGGDRSGGRFETDAAGQFTLSDIEPGKYQIEVRKDGYESPSRQCDSDKIQNGDDLTLISGQKLSGLKFQLLSPAVVTGTVFDPSGEPLTGAEVQAVSLYTYKGARTVSSASRSAMTDDRGQFRIFHVPPGRYFLRLKDDAYYFYRRSEAADNKTAKGGNGYLPIYYPDTTDMSRATLLELKPGEELSGIDFTIHPAQVLRISGRATNGLTGERINFGTVAVDQLPPAVRENGGQSITIDENKLDRKFEINDLVPGRYILSVDAWVLPDRKRWGGWQEIELTDSNVDDIQVKVFPGRDLVGRVRALVDKKLDFSDLQVALKPRGDSNYGFTFTNVGADGAFTLVDVKQDIYEISLAGLPSDYYLKSARLGTIDAMEDGLRIGTDPPASPLVLEVSSAGGQIDGTVHMGNGKAACTAMVVLIPEENYRSIERLYQTTEVDRLGHFILRGIAPGAYRVFAFDDLGEVEYRDSGSIALYEHQGQSATINEGDHRTISLNLIATGNKNP